ncbi:hypothetical protein MLD38_002705 [Melastoma candidum]|uniref:Uncharacterized protein n=1 Tax=Melastoma candidum TaxID=119954 RepID=A0ACB9S3Z8_9MYRT|nr:hypothetical protein MLD38_002705 [Melastoma candidum]
MQGTRFTESSALQIDRHDGFFSKLLSKESSAANSSSRVLYYDGAVRAVPFTWETCPGTPKRLPPSPCSFESAAHAYNLKPFLTPPPYYFGLRGSQFSETGFEVKLPKGPRFYGFLLRKLRQKRSAVSPTCSSSSKSSSSTASSPPTARKNKIFRGRHVLFLCSRSDSDHGDAVGQEKGGPVTGPE